MFIALNASAARTQAAEQTQRRDDECSGEVWHESEQQPSAAARAMDLNGHAAVPVIGTAANRQPSARQALGAINSLRSQSSGPYEQLNKRVCGQTTQVLKQRIEWATAELGKGLCVEYDIQLCNLIKSSADAIAALQGVSID